jgi:hypothetical protein
MHLVGKAAQPGENPPEASITEWPVKVVLEDFRREHPDDDCMYVTAVYPDGFKKNYQIMDSGTVDDLTEKIKTCLRYRYGVGVKPNFITPSLMRINGIILEFSSTGEFYDDTKANKGFGQVGETKWRRVYKIELPTGE